jgi:glucose/arabinose dehydrogenase/mono/diheme cytochrome c family protein
MPAEKGRWGGVYVFGNKAILNYTVGNTEIYEMPGSARFAGQTAFTRSFQINNSSSELYFTAAEVVNGSSAETKGGIAYIFHGTGKDTVTAIGVLGKDNSRLRPEVTANRYLAVRVVPGKKSDAALAVWKGPASQLAAFEKWCRKTHISLPDFKKGGTAHWGEAAVTKGKLSPDTAAFVTDQLALPLPNRWKRNVRVADIAFFRDGRAAAVTFEGDVWTIEGIDRTLQNVKWRRFASGLHEPMSVEVVKDTVYVFGREGIVRLHDLNKDGEADFYENFSNVMEQSPESREWAADMVYAPDKSFYIAKGGSLDNGPGMTVKAAKGFRAGSQQNGAILRITPDGKQSEVIATGLRGPYLGIHPEKGILTASDQQGNFVPSSPIFWIKKGDYYGVEPTMHRKDHPEVTPPLTWIPHRVDRSSLGQAWITGTKMGPLNGNLVHFSFGRPGLFRVLIDSSSKIIQGGVSVIHADYPAPTSKGAMNPADGQLYIAGFNLWGSSSNGISALLRLRYTGKQSYMPSEFRAVKQGIVLGFDVELDNNSAVDASNFDVKRWNYQRSEEYGSGHFKTNGSTGEETMTVAASYLSADRKKILLLVPDMTEIMQMEVSYKLKARDGKKMRDGFWFTVNNMSELHAQEFGFQNVDLALLSVKKQEEPASEEKEVAVSAARGKELFQKMACSGCHSEGLKTDGMYGPPFQHLYQSERHFEDGTKAIADEKYIRESILTPGKKIVKGYNEEMPSFVGILTDSDIESVTLFIKSLK